MGASGVLSQEDRLNRAALGDAQQLLAWLDRPDEPTLTLTGDAAAQAHGLVGLFEHLRSGFLARAHTHKAFSLTAKLAAALEGAMVPHVFLKGATCAAHWAPPEARFQADVDVLISLADAARGIDAIRGAGLLAKRGKRRRHHHHSVLETNVDGVRIVDLHHALGSAVPLVVPTEELIARRVRVRFGPRECWGLAPEDAAIFLAVHCAVHAAGRLAWLVDLRQLARTGPLRWPIITQRAHAWGCEIACWFSWRLAQSLVGAEIPQDALDAFAVSGWRRVALVRGWRARMASQGAARRLADMALRTVLVPTRAVPTQLWRRVLIRREIDSEHALEPE